MVGCECCIGNGRWNLKNSTFFGMFALLSTCDRPAVDPRKTPEGIEGEEILIIGHFFWRGVFGEVRLNQ